MVRKRITVYSLQHDYCNYLFSCSSTTTLSEASPLRPRVSCQDNFDSSARKGRARRDELTTSAVQYTPASRSRSTRALNSCRASPPKQGSPGRPADETVAKTRDPEDPSTFFGWLSLGSDEGAQRLHRQHAQVARHTARPRAGVEVRRHGVRARRERGLLAHLLTGQGGADLLLGFGFGFGLGVRVRVRVNG